MSRLAPYALLLLCACAGGSAERAAGREPAYVGLRHPPDTEGVETLGGVVFDGAPPAELVLSRMRDAEGEMLWLERIMSRDAGGRPLLEVLAVLRLPPIEPDQILLLGSCLRRGAPLPEDNRIAAIARATDDEEYSTILHAWRADETVPGFVPLATGDVRCLNMAAGI